MRSCLEWVEVRIEDTGANPENLRARIWLFLHNAQKGLIICRSLNLQVIRLPFCHL